MADINVKVYFGYSTILAAYALAQKNEQRLDSVEGVANSAQALANNHTTLIRHVEETANIAFNATCALNFGQGAMADADLYAWYASGVKIKSATWNRMGDYCFLSLVDVPTIDGWQKVYYSLPVQCIVPTHGIVKSAANQELYWSITDEPDKQVKVLCIAANDDTALVGSVVSFSLCYKFK